MGSRREEEEAQEDKMSPVIREDSTQDWRSSRCEIKIRLDLHFGIAGKVSD